MRLRTRNIMVIALTFMLIGSFVYAKSKKGSYCRMGSEHGGMYTKKDKDMDLEDKFFKKIHFIFAYDEKINLSDDQKDKIINEKFSLKKDLIDKKAKIKMLLIDLKKEFMQDDSNTGAINSLIDKKYNLKREKAKRIVSAYVNVKNILSQDQYDSLKDIWEKQMKYKMKGMLGEMGMMDKDYMGKMMMKKK